MSYICNKLENFLVTVRNRLQKDVKLCNRNLIFLVKSPQQSHSAFQSQLQNINFFTESLVLALHILKASVLFKIY